MGLEFVSMLRLLREIAPPSWIKNRLDPRDAGATANKLIVQVSAEGQNVASITYQGVPLTEVVAARKALAAMPPAPLERVPAQAEASRKFIADQLRASRAKHLLQTQAEATAQMRLFREAMNESCAKGFPFAHAIILDKCANNYGIIAPRHLPMRRRRNGQSNQAAAK